MSCLVAASGRLKKLLAKLDTSHLLTRCTDSSFVVFALELISICGAGTQIKSRGHCD